MGTPHLVLVGSWPDRYELLVDFYIAMRNL
jgi:hypothetical protein